ncbi:hypothetical protein AB6A40_002494, partial [Gnathostoma spinigerum]
MRTDLPTSNNEMRNVYVIGVGMTKFEKPGADSSRDYPEMVQEGVTKALNDAKITYKEIEHAVVGYIYGGTCCGQRSLYPIGLTGIPIFNVNNACASGSSALYLGKALIETGRCHTVLVVGFEKMARGSLENMSAAVDDRTNPMDQHIGVMAETYGLHAAPITAQMFGNAAKEHMEKYGTRREHFARIAQKNHRHSVNNPYAQFRKEYSLDEIINARKIYDFMGLLECSPTSDGAAAVVLCSKHFLAKHPHLYPQAVEIVGMEMGTDQPSVFAEKSNIKMIGFDLIKTISERLYKRTGLTPSDVQVIELHDCFAPNELITYEALGLCPVGKGREIVDRNDNTYGGRWVINPSGGLISKGHPIGATGVAQVVELCSQLRGTCGKRQVPNCRIAMQHNIGIGGAGLVALYRLAGDGLTSNLDMKNKENQFVSDAVFDEIKRRSSEESETIREVNSTFRINLTHGPSDAKKSWVIDCKQLPPFIGQRDGPVDVEVTMKDADFMLL